MSAAAEAASAATESAIAAAESTAAGVPTIAFTATVSAYVATTLSAYIATTVSAVAAAVAIASTVSIAVAAVSITAAEPGACTDEEAVNKIGRAIVSVGSAGIRGVAVVAVSANRGAISISRATDANADRNLGVGLGGKRRRDKKDA